MLNPESSETKTQAWGMPDPVRNDDGTGPGNHPHKTHVISEGVRNNIILFLEVRNNIGMGPKNLHETAENIYVTSGGGQK